MSELDILRQQIEREIHHAEDNDHHLAEDCQGVGSDKVPAVRIDYLRAALMTPGERGAIASNRRGGTDYAMRYVYDQLTEDKPNE